MAMPQVDWESIKSFVQIPLSWFKEVSRRSNLFSKHPLIVIDRNNPDGVGIGIDASQLPKGGGGGGGNFSFDAETNTISDGYFAISRNYIYVDAFVVPAGQTGTLFLKVTHKDGEYPSATFEFDGGVWPNNTSETTYIPMYYFKDGEMNGDYRGAPVVPLWE